MPNNHYKTIIRPLVGRSPGPQPNRSQPSESAGAADHHIRKRKKSVALPTGARHRVEQDTGYDGDDDQNDNDLGGNADSLDTSSSQHQLFAQADNNHHDQNEAPQAQNTDLGDVNEHDELQQSLDPDSDGSDQRPRTHPTIRKRYLGSCPVGKPTPRPTPPSRTSPRLPAKRDAEHAQLDDNAGEGPSKRHCRQ